MQIKALSWGEFSNSDLVDDERDIMSTCAHARSQRRALTALVFSDIHSPVLVDGAFFDDAGFHKIPCFGLVSVVVFGMDVWLDKIGNGSFRNGWEVQGEFRKDIFRFGANHVNPLSVLWNPGDGRRIQHLVANVVSTLFQILFNGLEGSVVIVSEQILDVFQHDA